MISQFFLFPTKFFFFKVSGVIEIPNVQLYVNMASYFQTFHSPLQLACPAVSGPDPSVGKIQLPDSQCSTGKQQQYQ